MAYRKESFLFGLILIDLGCAPDLSLHYSFYTRAFWADKSQGMLGVQMASAYAGTCLMPPLFGLIANQISVSLFPIYRLATLILMIVMHEMLLQKCKQERVLI